MKIEILTLFPAMLEGFLSESIIGRARTAGLLDIRVHNVRDWATDKHQVMDDRPFGGGAGMVMKPEPLFAAIEELIKPESKTVFLTPDGEPLTPLLAQELNAENHLILLSGHYEGIDQRVRDFLVDREVSIGDYVVTNGTVAAAVLVDVCARFTPGVLGDEKSLTHESFTGNLLDFPQYTRPAAFREMRVPEVLLSGNHADIEQWRNEQRLERTMRLRPDLIKKSHEPDH
jgi:tRNA (guanine37-N1)-methyltransferase